jgi:peptide-methionine (R)-S-oxide reductase
MADKSNTSEARWREILTPEQFDVLRQKGTERAFTGAYCDVKDPGTYRCAGCGDALFHSESKFESGSGWPSFYEAIEGGRVRTEEDHTLGMNRVEVLCASCGGHLGHVFPDGPTPTGLRYCINSVALALEPDETSGGD